MLFSVQKKRRKRATHILFRSPAGKRNLESNEIPDSRQAEGGQTVGQVRRFASARLHNFGRIRVDYPLITGD